MKTFAFGRLACGTLIALLIPVIQAAQASTVHVWSGSPSPGAPYTTWDTAAHDVQTAVHFAQADSATYPTVLVTNGVYAITNAQIHITEALTLVSVNGPEHTVLFRDASLDNRVLYIDNASALLEGFTVSNGWARGTSSALLGRNGGGIYLNSGTVRHSHIVNNTADRSGSSVPNNQSGGGIYMVAGLVEHCVIAGNQVLGEQVNGGGVSMNGAGTLRYSVITNNVINGSSSKRGSGVRLSNASALMHDCLIAGNSQAHAGAQEGAGVAISSGTMRNCTITGNTAINQPTAGVHRTGGSVINCIIFGNVTDLASGLNPQVNTTAGFTYSCAPELTSGTGNITLDPSFVDPDNGNYRLGTASPAINAGSNTGVAANDLDGNARISDGIVDMGAYERNLATGDLECDFTADVRAGFDTLEVSFTAAVSGVPAQTDITGYHWDFGDSQSDAGAGKDAVAHTYGPGSFTVTLTVTNSLDATATRTRTAYIDVYPSTVYVSPSGGNNPPYVSWTDAATDIVDAVAVAGVADGVGSVVLMTNGAYGVTSELFLQKGITLRGVNGPEHTALYRVGAQTTGQPQHRVLRIGNPDVVVDGLSITNGYGTELQGLGVYMHAGTLTNCHVRLNMVPQKVGSNSMQGAGLYMLGGLVTHCLIADNWLWHEQARGAGVNIEGGTLRNSIVRNNLLRGSSHERGSGIYMNNASTVVENSLVVSNITISTSTARADGPAVYVNHGTLRNTTVAHNTTTNNIVSGIYRGSNGTIVNTIAFGNVAVRVDNQEAQVGGSSALPTGFTYSCAPELMSGTGNISANPELKADFTLEPVSPVIDEGDNDAVQTTTDLAGNPRVIGGTVDMGAYEFDPLAGDLECSLAATLTDGFDTLTTTFTAAATGPNTNLVYYWWDFGDGNTEEGAGLGSVTHTYTTLGTFDVSLMVENEHGAQADTTRSAYITTHASTVYVSPAGNHAPPFADWSSAATNIQAAVDTGWHDGSTGTLIRVAAAAYPLMAALEIPVGVTLRADDGPGATTLYRAGSGEYSVVRIAHAAAVVDGFTITNGLSTSSAVWGAGVHISAGTLRNSHVLHNHATGGNSRRGGGVYISNGLVEDCLIAHNSMVVSQSIAGGGIYLEGGTLRRSIIRDNTLSGWPSGTGVHAGGSSIVESCLIVNNVSTGSSNYETGAGLRLGSASAVVRNTTISGNTANPVLATVGGLYRSDGTVINTIIHGNTVDGDVSDINTTSGVTYSCAPELTSGMGNLVSAPAFRDPGAGDYTLAHGSPAIGVGYYDDTWMPGATDLAGNPRFKKDLTVDMGAYETQPPGGTLFLLR